MPPLSRQNASLLLLNNLLSVNPGTSPFTLVQDTVEQSARPLIRHVIQNALHAKPSVNVLHVLFEFTPKYLDSLRSNADLWVFRGNREAPDTLLQDIHAAVEELKQREGGKIPRLLIVIDTLHPLASLGTTFNLSQLLSSLLSIAPGTSLFAVHHLDIPLPDGQPRYSPAPSTLLTYLATTVVTIHFLPQILSRKQARDRSLEEPAFGLSEEKEGVLVALKGNVAAPGMVLEVEHRRKSGRIGSGGWFYLPPLVAKGNGARQDQVCLLRDHPLFSDGQMVPTHLNGEDTDKSTFDLALTEKQRLDREGVVLPYFDAQKGKGGAGEGGRILYDMGVEDDFDEEEDEI